MDWLIIVIVTAATAVALIVVFKIHRDRLRRRFRLEILNEGNVQSRYRLRAEGPGALRFRFMVNGDDLPQEEHGDPQDVAPGRDERGLEPPTGASGPPRPKAGSAGQRLGQAAGLTAVVADVLMALGSLLPHSMGGPLLRRASQLQMGRIRMAQARRVSGQVAGLGSSARPASVRSAPGVPGPAPRMTSARQTGPREPGVETPFVRPGQTLAIELLVRTAAAQAQAQSFRIISRSIEQENAPLLVEEGHVRISGGFWSRRYLPYLVTLAIGIVVLLLALWVSGSSSPF